MLQFDPGYRIWVLAIVEPSDAISEFATKFDYSERCLSRAVVEFVKRVALHATRRASEASRSLIQINYLSEQV